PGRPPLRGAGRLDRRPRGLGLPRRWRAADPAARHRRRPARGRGPAQRRVIELATAAPKRLRHTGDWPTPAPRRAAAGTELRALQDAMPRCEADAPPVLSGDGTERAMLIGQAPGWREIETGLPFAWDAGKRLCGWFAAAGIGVDDFRQRWYVTSVTKCYPGRAPGSSVDRPPSRTDVLAWTPFLRDEVRLVEPRLVVLIGGVAHRFAFGPDVRL